MSDFRLDISRMFPSQGKFSVAAESSILDVESGRNISPSETKIFNYFQLYLKFWYYFGVIPFKARFDQNTEKYQILKLNRIQKVCTKNICNVCIASLKPFHLVYVTILNFQIFLLVVWVILLLYMLSVLRTVWQKQKDVHPVMHYFQIVRVHMYSVMPIVYYKTVSNAENMRKMLNATHLNSLINRSTKSYEKAVSSKL